MTQEFMQKMAEIDEVAERAGGYLAPFSAKNRAIRHDYRALMKHCKERGIKPSSLTESELDSFRV